MKRPKPPSLRSPDYGSPAPGAASDNDEPGGAAAYAHSSGDFGRPPQRGEMGRGRPGARSRGPGQGRRQRAQAAGGGFGTEAADHHDYGRDERDDRY